MQANAIVFINQKGGVAKTTTAAAVMVEAARGRVRVMGADLDGKQRALQRWATRRTQHAHLPSVDVRAVTFAGARLMAEDCDLLIVDTPGWTDVETIELANYADLIVIPTSSNRDELDPSALLVQALWKHEIHPEKIAVVMTRVLSEAQEQEARKFLAQIDIEPLRPSLADRAAWRAVGDDGRTICETGIPSLDAEARAHITSIGQALERARRLQATQILNQQRNMRRGRGRRL